MAASIPPTARKRPWYLVVALVIASVFGATGFVDGWGIITYYRTSDVDLSALVREIDDDHERADAKGALDRYVEALDVDKSRMFPLSVAELLLGMTLFALSAGAMAGRKGARSALVQVVGVQAAVVVLMYFLTAHVRLANRDLAMALEVPKLSKGNDPELVQQTMAVNKKLVPVLEVGYLVVRSLVAGFVLVALTRKRSLAWYEPASEA